ERSRRGEDQELEREGAPDAMLSPGPVVVRAAAPLLPEAASRCESRLDSTARGHDDGFLVGCGERKQPTLARFRCELRRDPGLVGLRLTGVPRLDRDPVVRARREEDARALVDARVPLPVVETRLQAPAHRDRTA